MNSFKVLNSRLPHDKFFKKYSPGLLFFGEMQPYKTDKRDTAWAVTTSQRKLLSNAAAEVLGGGVQGLLSCRSSFLEYSSIRRLPSQHHRCHPISSLCPFLRPFFRWQASRTSRFPSVSVSVVFPHYKDWPGLLQDWPLALPISGSLSEHWLDPEKLFGSFFRVNICFSISR